MTDQAKDAATAVKDALERLDGLEEQFKTMKGMPAPANENQSGTQQVTQVTNSGDRTATWVLIAATMLVLGINVGQRDTIAQQSAQLVMMQSQMNDVKAQVRRVEDYQNTTYQLVPKLREEVQRIIDSRKEAANVDGGDHR